MADYGFRSAFNEKWGALAKQVIRQLSENSRMSITELSKKLDVSRKTVEDKIKAAEKELDIKYTLELDEAALGLDNPHMIMIKFTAKPDYAKIKQMLAGSHIPQLVMRINGGYDLLLYANSEDPNEYVYWDKTTQVLLSDYRARWEPSDLAFRHLGFFPLRNQLLEKLKIPKIYRDMLLLLNDNARMSYSEMARRLGMKQATLRYRFKKLLKIGYIKRFTIVIRKPPKVSMLSLFGEYIISKGFEDDSMSMRKEITFVDDRTPLISRCLFSAQLIGSYDFFFVGVYDDYNTGYERLVRYYKQRFRRHAVKAVYGTLGNALIGDFPVRNLDVRKEFNMIRWVPGAKPTVEK